MKLNLGEKLVDYDGEPLKDQAGKEITLRSVVINALNTLLPGENPPPDQKLSAFKLSLKVHDNVEAELTLEERMLIKERVGKLYNPLVFGRVTTLLEE